MKLKIDKTMAVLGLVVTLSSLSAILMLSGNAHLKLDEGLVKAAKKLRW